jgi:hypothetical protein
VGLFYVGVTHGVTFGVTKMDENKTKNQIGVTFGVTFFGKIRSFQI